MTQSGEIDVVFKEFSGLVPLFPLPNVVLFPHALLPLQIFEPRYRRMTADVLDGERLIAMSLMRPGWDQLSSNAVPPIHRMVGLGRIIAHEKLDDGRYYLVLRGVARAKLVGEKSVDLPYRIGQLELCSDVESEIAAIDRQDQAEQLVSKFVQLFPGVNLRQLFLQAATELPLGNVCDILLGSIPMAPEQAQRFLDELNVNVRCQMLANLLDQMQADPGRTADSIRRDFPPNFSAN